MKVAHPDVEDRISIPCFAQRYRGRLAGLLIVLAFTITARLANRVPSCR